MVLTEIIPSIYIGGVDDVLDAAAAGCTYILSMCPGGIGEGKDLPTECTNHMAVEVCLFTFLSISLDANAVFLPSAASFCVAYFGHHVVFGSMSISIRNTTQLSPRFHYPHPFLSLPLVGCFVPPLRHPSSDLRAVACCSPFLLMCAP